MSRKVVVLGMMTKIPVAGVVWQTVHYLVGLRRLGCDVYYVEAHSRTPSMFMQTEHDDGSGKAAAFIARVMGRFGFVNSWAYHALHDDGCCYGLTEGALRRLCREADLLINLHGGTVVDAEMAATGRLVYVETDPVQVQLELDQGDREVIDYLEPHCAFFTFGENYGRPECLLPVSDRFRFLPTRQPVVLDFWENGQPPGNSFTTIGQWRQDWRDVELNGEVYRWSKHHEFLKFLDLPRTTGQDFELALGTYEQEDRELLEDHGWQVRPAEDLSDDIDAYRDFIRSSRAEFTVAKDQNVRLRTGWFSDRSAAYLASGRPVITQDTGFGSHLPTGEGLFAFSTLDEAAAAVEAVNGDYERHSRAARDIAREYFDSDRVLSRMLEECDAATSRGRLWRELVLEPISRRPIVLAPTTQEVAATTEVEAHPAEAEPVASIIIVTHDALPFTRLCLHTLTENTETPPFEVIVVDNGSGDGTPEFLQDARARDARIRAVLNPENRGFAAANNQGIALARGTYVALLNNDTITAPGWLRTLLAHLEDPTVGLVGPVTNRAGNEAQLDLGYRTYGEFLDCAEECRLTRAGEAFDIPMLTMFCVAMRREVLDEVGPLDERFGLGLLEDDDYSRRVRDRGYRLVCADDVLVHHFGEASFGRLFATGEWSKTFAENRQQFEEKWGHTWAGHGRREEETYEELKARIRRFVTETLPDDAVVLVVSRGDEALLDFEGRQARHFPQIDGEYAGHYPASSEDAVGEIERLRCDGAQYLLFPATSLWWLDHYAGLQQYLEASGTVAGSDEACLIYALGRR